MAFCLKSVFLCWRPIILAWSERGSDVNLWSLGYLVFVVSENLSVLPEIIWKVFVAWICSECTHYRSVGL